MREGKEKGREKKGEEGRDRVGEKEDREDRKRKASRFSACPPVHQL